MPRLAPTTAALWILLSGICAVMMNVLIRVAAQSMHPFEVAFFRCLFGLVLVLPWIIKAGPGLLRGRNAGFYLLRAAVGLVSMVTWFYGITLVPLATATAVNFTAPLFATIAAVFVLHEDVRLRRWSAVVIGFVGVLVIMRPGSERLDANLLILLLSAASAAMNNITVKFLARTEPPGKVVAMFMIYLTPLSLIPALFVWRWPEPSTLGALVGLGCRHNRTSFGCPGARGGRCQRLRAVRVRPTAFCSADRIPVVRRSHRCLDLDRSRHHRRVVDLCRVSRGSARKAGAPRRAACTKAIAALRFPAHRQEERMEIEGQAAIVSGGGSGLGRATAETLAAGGARVAILDVNEAAATEAARETGGFAIGCDVTDAAAVEAAVAAAHQRHGPARIAVNCAGVGTAGRIVGRDGPLPLDAFRRVIEVNLIGSFNLLRVAAVEMTKLDPLADGERGIIVSTASVAAYDGQIGQAAYSASKGGIVSLTLPAARELARYGVRVVAIAPGIFETPMLEGLPQNVQESLAASVPFPSRLGRPAEYAALVLHLCQNRMINGEVIRLDGALRMAPR